MHISLLPCPHLASPSATGPSLSVAVMSQHLARTRQLPGSRTQPLELRTTVSVKVHAVKTWSPACHRWKVVEPLGGKPGRRKFEGWWHAIGGSSRCSALAFQPSFWTHGSIFSSALQSPPLPFGNPPLCAKKPWSGWWGWTHQSSTETFKTMNQSKPVNL